MAGMTALGVAAALPVFSQRLVGGETLRVETNYGDLMAWERYADKHDLNSALPFNVLGFYAWRAARKHGLCPQDVGLEDFAERFAGGPEIHEFGASGDPTQSALGDD